ncbi:MAG: Ig-like domain-containing protein [Treponema sp.]|nr:Ig-like domain-containing protein [Treponema sp.]
MKKSVFQKSVLSLFSIIILFAGLNFTACDSWMSSDDGFYDDVEEEVRVANAPEITAFIRYAATKEGTTSPSGASTVKVEVPFTVTCTTETEYGFYKWAAFSTSGDNGYSTSSQHTNLLYVDSDDYAENFASKELPDSVITFSDPTATQTQVTIHEERNDIFIIPVVAERPVLSTSLPASGAGSVVRNMAIRLVFSKPMDESTLVTENGTLTDNIHIYKTTGDFDNMTLTEISNQFTNVSLGSTKKTLTIRLATGEKLDSNTTNRVTISGDVKDTCGYTMSDSTFIQFTTGTAADSMAPRIEVLTGGFTNATSWGCNQSVNSSSDLGDYFVPVDASASSSYVNKTASISSSASSTILDHRTTGLVNLYVYARDIAEGSSSFVEADVYQLYITATYLASSTGGETGANIARKLYSYNAGGAASGVTRTVEGNVGYQLQYDLSSLPDGLVRIDVGAADIIGNDSFTSDCISSSELNYIKSLYVIKDTTSPDSASQTAKVSTVAVESAPYHWYNANSIASLKIEQANFASDPIVDKDDENLRCKPENLQWCFSLDDGENWSDWALAGGQYSISNAASIAHDGQLNIKYKLKDDVGNVSTDSSLSSINYDNTTPLVGSPDWINSDGSLCLGATASGTLPILKLPFTEELSGIKKTVVTITGGGGDSSVESAVYQYQSADGTLSDIAQTSGVFENACTSGTLRISNLILGDTEGQYTIKVQVLDSALNASSEATITAVRDRTAPVINSIKILNLQKIVDKDTNSSTYWAPLSTIENGLASKLTLEYDITETGTGIKEVRLGSSVKLQSNSQLFKTSDGSNYELVTDYSLDVENNKFILNNYTNPELKGTNVKFRITNVKLDNTGSTINTISSSLVDQGGFESTNPTSNFIYTSGEGSESVSGVYVDITAPSFAATNPLVISDTSTNNQNYTNSDSITAAVSFLADGGSGTGSGYKTVTFTGASMAASGVEVYVDSLAESSKLASSEYTYTPGSSSLSLTNVYGRAHTIYIKGVQLTAPELGALTISAVITDGAGWTSSSASSNSIIYDTVAPEIASDAMYWEYDEGYTAGVTAEYILGHQTLVIPFTETFTGLGKVTVEVKYNNTSLYENPFASDDFAAKIGDTRLSITKSGTSFTINDISLSSLAARSSAQLKLYKLKIADAAQEGSYTIYVKLTDAAENEQTSERTIAIANDSTAPVVNRVEISGLKLVEEKAVSGTSQGPADSYFITGSNYINNGALPSSNEAPSNVNLYVTITEAGSGLKQLTLGGSALLQSGSKIYKVSNHGATESLEDLTDKCSFQAGTNYFTVNTKTDAAHYFASSSAYILLISGLKFTGYGENANTVSVVAKDVAMIESTANSTINIDASSSSSCSSFYSDSLWPVLSDLTLVDRQANGYLEASSGYTNESLVTIRVKVSNEVANSSGLHAFKLQSGASFTDTSAVRVGSTVDNLASVNGLNFVLSDSNTMLTFTDDTNANFVVRGTYIYEFTNVQLASTTEGSHSVSLSAFDSIGWQSPNSDSSAYGYNTASIILDTTNPEWGTTSGSGLYVADAGDQKNYVYPKSSGKTSFGLNFDTSVVNGDNNKLRYFYTKASYNSECGMLLGIWGKDNIALRGASSKTFYYCYRHNSETLTDVNAAYVLQHSSGTSCTSNGSGYNPTSDNRAYTTVSSSASDCTGTDSSLVQLFKAGGTYSVVIADEAGNVSPAYSFVVVEETTCPATTLSDNSTSLENAAVLDIPAGIPDCAKWYQASENRDLSGYGLSATQSVVALSIGNFDYKFRIRLATDITTSDRRIQNNSTITENNSSKYGELNPSVTQSGLAAYAITYWYNSSTTSPKAPEPVVSGSSDIYCSSSESNCESNSYWRPYQKAESASSISTFSDNRLTSYVDQNGDIVICLEKGVDIPPLTLLLKDNCGNVSSVLLSSIGSSTYMWHFYNKLGGVEITSSSRHVIQYPVNKDEGASATDSYDFVFNGYDNTTPHYYTNANATSSYYGTGSRTDFTSNSRLGETMRDIKNNVTYYSNKAVACLSLNGLDTPSYSNSTEYGTCTDSVFTTTAISTFHCRLLASQSAEKPSRTDFNTTSSAASAWTWTKQKSLGVYLPRVNYSDLGWTANSPYYIYYLVENYLGNYEIGRLVNGTDDSSMTKWLYDNEAPVITVAGTTTSPESVAGNGLSSLVASTNGHRPYYDGTDVWVWGESSDERELPSFTEQANGVAVQFGNNTIYQKHYWPLLNLQVSEKTGVRAYYYDTISDAVATVSSNVDSSNHGYGTSKWFLGGDNSDVGIEIGAATAASQTSYNNYQHYSSDSIYSNSFSGVKVYRQVPVTSLSESEAKFVYLHVMDWVGNVTTYKIGNFGWKKDQNGPVISDQTYAASFVNESHYMQFDGTSATLQIAGAGKTESSSNLNITIPSSTSGYWHSDAGSGIAGYTYNSTADIANLQGSNYFTLSYSNYSDWPSSTPEASNTNYYIYDNVGNRTQVPVKASNDTVAPGLLNTLKTYTGSTTSYIYRSGLESSGFKVSLTDASESAIIASITPEDSSFADTCSTYYTKNGSIYVTPSTEGIGSETWTGVISRWASSSWTTLSTLSYSSESAEPLSVTDISSNSGSYYRVSLSDQVGNTRYAFYRFFNDTSAPSFTPSYVVNTGLAGGPGSSPIYYKDISIKLSNVSDGENGSGVKQSTLYKGSSGTSGTAISYTSDTIAFTPSSTTDGTSDVIKISMMDNLGNFSGQVSLGTFVYDATAPVVAPASSTVRTWRSRYVGSGTKEDNIYNYSPVANTSNEYNLFITSTMATKVIYDLSASATDTTSGVKGWIESDSSTAPAVSSSTTFSSSFEHSCGISDGSYDIKLDGTEYVRYYYAVDYAGNVSTPIKVTYKYANIYAPSISGHSFDKIYEKETTYYYNSTNLSLTVTSEYAVPNKLILIYGESDDSYTTFTTSSGLTVSGSSPSYTCTISLPEFTNKTLSAVVSCPYGNSETYAVTNGSFTKDSVAPDVSAVTITPGANSYLSDNTICFKSGIESLSLTLAGASDSASGIFGYSITSSDVTTPTCPESVANVLSISSPSGGTSYKLYAWDNVGNYSLIGTYTLSADSSVSPITSSTVTTSSGSVYQSAANASVYFKGTPSIPVSLSVSDSDIAYYYADSDSEANRQTPSASGASVSFTISPSSDSENHSFYAVDKVGNVSSAYTLSFVKDETAPATPSVCFTAIENVYPAPASTTTPLTADTTYYINATTYASEISVNLSASDTASGISEINIESGSNVISTTTVNGVISATLNPAADTETTYTVTAVDNLGNESTTFTFKLVKDSLAPAPTTLQNGNLMPTFSSTLYLGYDSDGDYTNYITNFYPADTTITFESTEAGSGLASYGYSTDSSTEPSSYTELTATSNLALPVITNAHTNIYIWLKDKVGNKASYSLAGTNKNYTWFTQYASVSPTYTVTSSSSDSTSGYDNYDGQYIYQNIPVSIVITVPDTPVQTAIKSITLNNTALTLSSVAIAGTTTTSYAPSNPSISNGVISFDSEKSYIPIGGTITLSLVLPTYSIDYTTGDTVPSLSDHLSTINSSIVITSIADVCSSSLTPSRMALPSSSKSSGIKKVFNNVSDFFTHKTKSISYNTPLTLDTAASEEITDVKTANFGSFDAKKSDFTSQITEKTDNIIKKENKIKAQSASAALIEAKNSNQTDSARLMAASPIQASSNEALVAENRLAESKVIEENELSSIHKPSEAGGNKLVTGLIIFAVIGLIAAAVFMTRRLIDKQGERKL